MPTYDYHCIECGSLVERYVEMEKRDAQMCEQCGLPILRLPSMPQLNTTNCKFESYYDETLGSEVHTERQRQYEMAKKGLKDYEPDSEGKALRDEMKYVRKHSQSERDVKAFAGKAGTELRKKQRERAIKEKVREGLKGV
jgi:putative FmdB family regulatory protein